MKSIFFLPAAAFAASHYPGAGNVGKNYAQDYDIEDFGNGFQCDIDGNATYEFQITSGNGFIKGAANGDGTACTFGVEVATNGLSAKATLNKDCFSHNEADGHKGKIDIFISASKDDNLYFGKVWQNMTCTMKRDHSVTYNFTQIMLDTEEEGALSDGGENGYLLTRRTADYKNMTDDTKNVTSGETLYFQVDAVGDYEKFDFDISACSVNKGDDTYYLADLYKQNGAGYCIDSFLATSFTKYRDDAKWTFTYEAFTFKTDNQSDVSLTCDIEACQKAESETSGWCPQLHATCFGNANLKKEQVKAANPCDPNEDDDAATKRMKRVCESHDVFPGILEDVDGKCNCNCDTHDYITSYDYFQNYFWDMEQTSYDYCALESYQVDPATFVYPQHRD